jgi:hypothetical protein
MSGSGYHVGGIQVARLGSDPLPDRVICSVFYQMAEFANDDSVRQGLQTQISQGGALELPPVSVSDLHEQDRTRAATITGGQLQVTIPLSRRDPDIALDTRDLSICTAILASANSIQDALLRASAQNGAKAGLERIAQVFAEDVAHYQALGVSLIVQDGSIQVMWNNVPGTTQVQVERWEVDQPTPQLIATLDGSSTSFRDTTVSSSKSYVYDVKNLSHSELVAAGYSKRVRASGTVLANIQHHVIAHISGRLYGVAGYYSDNDSTQHVVVATNDGTLYEIHWNRTTAPTSPQRLAQFNHIASLSGFFTSDDNFQHVIVATEDGRLHEVYFTNPQRIHVRSPVFQLTTTAGPHIGMAGFSTSDDGLRHATVGGADSILHEVAWSAQVPPTARNLATQFTLPDVAAIAGFFDLSVHSRDVIVAMKGGNIYDVHYSGAILGGGSITTNLVTTFSPPLVNVAAFVSTETWERHVIVLHASGQLYDYSYTPQQVFGQTSLVSIANVIDIAAYYSAYDTTCHVIAATSDGNLHEVYYG